MKRLDHKEFQNAPVDIQYLWLAALYNIPVGMSFYEKCKEDYPEYFI